MIGAVTNPGAVQVKGRRKNLQKIWSSREWKEKKAAFLSKNPFCSMHQDCGIHEDATVPHHPGRDSYKGHYTDLELSCCVAYCARCHFAIHHGLKLCKTCGEHYHPWDAEECRYCFDKKHPEIVAAREKFIQDRKALQKKLRKAASDKAKAYKKAHPQPELGFV
jgi:hypothetical protein